MTTLAILAYFVVGIVGVVAWNYYRPWDDLVLHSPAPIGAAIAWPIVFIVAAAAIARDAGVARRQRAEDERRQAEIDAREVDRLLRADGAR